MLVFEHQHNIWNNVSRGFIFAFLLSIKSHFGLTRPKWPFHNVLQSKHLEQQVNDTMAWRISLATVFKLLSWEYISRECFMQLFVFIPLPNDNASLYKNAGGNVQHWREQKLGGLHAQRILILLGVHDHHWACAVHCGTQVSVFCVKKKHGNHVVIIHAQFYTASRCLRMCIYGYVIWAWMRLQISCFLAS